VGGGDLTQGGSKAVVVLLLFISKWRESTIKPGVGFFGA
jgi:hypothetical protein